MSDDLTSSGAQDRTRIDVSQEHECRYWSRKLGVRPKELKRAVRAVGNRVEDVEQRLGEVRMEMPIGVPDMGTAD